jgi:hypothetical protein
VQHLLLVPDGGEDASRRDPPALIELLGGVDVVAIDADRCLPVLAVAVEAAAERAIDEGDDEVVVDAALDEGHVVRAHLDRQAVGLLLAARSEAPPAETVVGEQQVLDGHLVVREVDVEEEVPVLEHRGGHANSPPAHLDAVGGVRLHPGSNVREVSRVAGRVEMEASAEPELEPPVVGPGAEALGPQLDLHAIRVLALQRHVGRGRGLQLAVAGELRVLRFRNGALGEQDLEQASIEGPVGLRRRRLGVAPELPMLLLGDRALGTQDVQKPLVEGFDGVRHRRLDDDRHEEGGEKKEADHGESP